MHSLNSTHLAHQQVSSAFPAYGYRADIDGLRAVAVLSVLIFHLSAAFLPGGLVGVDIFFVISGFVVSAAMAQAPSLSLPRFVAYFYARRLLRIVPALVVVLSLTVLIATLLIPRAWLSSLSERTALYAFFGLSNWVLQSNADSYFSPRAEFNPYTHTWSLGVEEQFYLIFPLLFFAWTRWRSKARARSAASGLFAVLGLFSLLACYWATKQQPQAAFYGIAFRFWELALGVCLFQLTATQAPHTQHPGKVQAIVQSALPWFGILSIALSFAFANTSQFPWFWALPPVLGTALVIGGCNADAAHPVRRFLALPVCVWIGKRSYSLYLWHWPVFVLFRWTVGLDDYATRLWATVLTVILATLSYRWVELPIRHHPVLNRLSAGVRILLMLALILFSWGFAREVLKRQDRLCISTVARNADQWYVFDHMPKGLIDKARSTRHCLVKVTHGVLAGGWTISYTPKFCRAPKPGSPAAQHRVKARLSVIGDSHATAYSPMFEQLSAELGTEIQLYSYPGCGFLDLRFPMSQALSPECIRFTERVSAQIAESAKAGDVLFLPSLRQPRFTDQWLTLDHEAVWALERSASYQQLSLQAQEDAVVRLQPLLNAGVSVLFDAPKPVFLAPAFRCVDPYNRTNPICAGGLTRSKSELETLRTPVMSNLLKLSEQYADITIWDSFPVLCPEAQCQMIRDGRPLFFDGDHVSAYGNAVLYPHFRDQLSTLMQRSAPSPR